VAVDCQPWGGPATINLLQHLYCIAFIIRPLARDKHTKLLQPHARKKKTTHTGGTGQRRGGKNEAETLALI
jgi:hypothetical protein